MDEVDHISERLNFSFPLFISFFVNNPFQPHSGLRLETTYGEARISVIPARGKA
jgi:hypothetical protein